MPNTDRRTLPQLRKHYEIERELAVRLKRATRGERLSLYAECYDELFRRVPDHPQLIRKSNPEAQLEAVASRRAIVDRHLDRECTFMEIGPGDCSLAISLCSKVKRVYAVDVSTEITSQLNPPVNFELILSDGTNIPVPAASVDVAFSYQLVEHLHEDDAAEHASQVSRALKPGGIYICVTPSRLNGPHDVSRHFDAVASGFHMREYTHRELIELFKGTGFTHAQPLLGVGGRFFRMPTEPIAALERTLDALPPRFRRAIAERAPFYRLLGAMVVATK